MKTRTLQLRNSANWLRIRFAFLLIALACFALAPQARAVNPPPDGGYPDENTAEGDDALFSLTAAGFDTAVGFNALFSERDGSENTAIGDKALYGNTHGTANTAIGAFALQFNTTGLVNTATGDEALHNNTIGSGNTADGRDALYTNTTGYNNTATGINALFSNTSGNNNTATGNNALFFNTTAYFNTATGVGSLYLNTTGSDNTATGFGALQNNTTGSDNTATGLAALDLNTTGSNNTADGLNALNHNTTGSNNIALGFNAGSKLVTGSNNIYIGSRGNFTESRTIRIGDPSNHERTSIAGISGVAVAAGVGVIIDTKGQLGTVVSSERFKDGIKPMDKASEAILRLKPVTFRYKKDLDPDGIPQFGLVAEDVEKVNPDLVAWDADGKPYTVRYEAVNAMLLNEFLKEQKKVEEQQATIAQLKSTVAQQQEHLETKIAKQEAQIDVLTVGLQKVSAQLELKTAKPNTVRNH